MRSAVVLQLLTTCKTIGNDVSVDANCMIFFGLNLNWEQIALQSFFPLKWKQAFTYFQVLFFFFFSYSLPLIFKCKSTSYHNARRLGNALRMLFSPPSQKCFPGSNRSCRLAKPYDYYIFWLIFLFGFPSCRHTQWDLIFIATCLSLKSVLSLHEILCVSQLGGASLQHARLLQLLCATEILLANHCG